MRSHGIYLSALPDSLFQRANGHSGEKCLFDLHSLDG